jgi:hypothetical protein
VRRGVAHIGGNRPPVLLDGVVQTVDRATVLELEAPKVVVVRLGGRRSSPLALSRRKNAHLQRGHHGAGDLVLDGEDIGQVAVEGLRPELVAIRGVDQLRGDAQSGAGLADASFQDMGHVELLAHGSQILALALEVEGRRTRSDVQAGDLDQGVDDLLRHAVGEVLLIVLGAHVHEGQDGDRG